MTDALATAILDRLDQISEQLNARMAAIEVKLLEVLAAQGGVDPMFTDEEMAELTGYCKEVAQRKRLAGPENGGWRFYRVGAKGLTGASHLAEYQRRHEVPQRREGLHAVSSAAK